jgi:hypothetical protein
MIYSGRQCVVHPFSPVIRSYLVSLAGVVVEEHFGVGDVLFAAAGHDGAEDGAAAAGYVGVGAVEEFAETGESALDAAVARECLLKRPEPAGVLAGPGDVLERRGNYHLPQIRKASGLCQGLSYKRRYEPCLMRSRC